MSGIINIASKAAYSAASIIQNAMRNKANFNIQKKDGINNFVTDIDKKSEQIIIDTIKKAYPDHNILSEEIGNIDNNSEYTWIIDPLDGTTNFIHGHPDYSISIALRHNDRITHGVVFDLNRNDLYHAELGMGSFLNNKRIRVSKVNYLSDSLIGTGFPTYDVTILNDYIPIFRDLLLNSSGLRRSGSAAIDLAYVAAGQLDGFWEFSLKPWDVAAGSILIKEAGGMLSDFNAEQKFWDSGNIVAGNPKIIIELLKVIQSNFHKKN